ncbi:MAG: flagellar basal body-associated FliL family protein [Gammaproteobacteria bacterium]
MADSEKHVELEGPEGKGKGKGKDKAKAESSGPNHMKLVIVGAVALFVAVLGAQVAAPLLNRVIEDHSKAAPAKAEGEEEAAAEAAAPIELAAADAEKPEKKEPVEPAKYVGLDPPFVVSFDEQDGTRYVQLQLQAMARSEKTIEEIKKHAPALRNSILFLLNGYKLEELTTLAGKERLRSELTTKANEVLAKNGSEGEIEELYFTNFVIQ